LISRSSVPFDPKKGNLARDGCGADRSKVHAARQLPIDRPVDYDDNRHDVLVRSSILRANPGNNTWYNADA
jgi:hypothetical protein